MPTSPHIRPDNAPPIFDNAEIQASGLVFAPGTTFEQALSAARARNPNSDQARMAAYLSANPGAAANIPGAGGTGLAGPPMSAEEYDRIHPVPSTVKDAIAAWRKDHPAPNNEYVDERNPPVGMTRAQARQANKDMEAAFRADAAGRQAYIQKYAPNEANVYGGASGIQYDKDIFNSLPDTLGGGPKTPAGSPLAPFVPPSQGGSPGTIPNLPVAGPIAPVAPKYEHSTSPQLRTLTQPILDMLSATAKTEPERAAFLQNQWERSDFNRLGWDLRSKMDPDYKPGVDNMDWVFRGGKPAPPATPTNPAPPVVQKQPWGQNPWGAQSVELPYWMGGGAKAASPGFGAGGMPGGIQMPGAVPNMATSPGTPKAPKPSGFNSLPFWAKNLRGI